MTADSSRSECAALPSPEMTSCLPADGCDDTQDISEADSLLTSPSYTSCTTDDSPPSPPRCANYLTVCYTGRHDNQEDPYYADICSIFNLTGADCNSLLEYVTLDVTPPEAPEPDLPDLHTDSDHQSSGSSTRPGSTSTLASTLRASPSCLGGAAFPLELPSLAVVLFLLEDDMLGSARLERAEAQLRARWRFHHREPVSGPRLQAYPSNSVDYWTLRDTPADDCDVIPQTLPLCSLRQIHAGAQSVRLARYVSSEVWDDTVALYSLLLQGTVAQRPRKDLVLFLTGKHQDYEVQLSLRKLPTGISALPTSTVALQFRVRELGQLVPLLPNVCTQLTSQRWCTTDMDGNLLFLLVDESLRYDVTTTIHATALDLPSRHSSSTVPGVCANCSRSIHTKAKKQRRRNKRLIKHLRDLSNDSAIESTAK